MRERLRKRLLCELPLRTRLRICCDHMHRRTNRAGRQDRASVLVTQQRSPLWQLALAKRQVSEFPPVGACFAAVHVFLLGRRGGGLFLQGTIDTHQGVPPHTLKKSAVYLIHSSPVPLTQRVCHVPRIPTILNPVVIEVHNKRLVDQDAHPMAENNLPRIYSSVEHPDMTLDATLAQYAHDAFLFAPVHLSPPLKYSDSQNGDSSGLTVIGS